MQAQNQSAEDQRAKEFQVKEVAAEVASASRTTKNGVGLGVKGD
jgi:hypothetical protein